MIKHSEHLRTLEKCRKHSPAARVFCRISLVFSNARRALSQCNSRLRLLYLLNNVAHPTFFSSGEHCDSFGGGTSSSFAVLSVSSDKGTYLSSKVLENTILMKKLSRNKEWRKVDKDDIFIKL